MDAQSNQPTAKHPVHHPTTQSQKQGNRVRDMSRNQHPAHQLPTHSHKQNPNSKGAPSTIPTAEHLAHPSLTHFRNQSSSVMDTPRNQPTTEHSAPHLQHSAPLPATKRLCRFGNGCWFRNLYCPFSHPPLNPLVREKQGKERDSRNSPDKERPRKEKGIQKGKKARESPTHAETIRRDAHSQTHGQQPSPQPKTSQSRGRSHASNTLTSQNHPPLHTTHHNHQAPSPHSPRHSTQQAHHTHITSKHPLSHSTRHTNYTHTATHHTNPKERQRTSQHSNTSQAQAPSIHTAHLHTPNPQSHQHNTPSHRHSHSPSHHTHTHPHTPRSHTSTHPHTHHNLASTNPWSPLQPRSKRTTDAETVRMDAHSQTHSRQLSPQPKTSQSRGRSYASNTSTFQPPPPPHLRTTHHSHQVPASHPRQTHHHTHNTTEHPPSHSTRHTHNHTHTTTHHNTDTNERGIGRETWVPIQRRRPGLPVKRTFQQSQAPHTHTPHLHTPHPQPHQHHTPSHHHSHSPPPHRTHTHPPTPRYHTPTHPHNHHIPTSTNPWSPLQPRSKRTHENSQPSKAVPPPLKLPRPKCAIHCFLNCSYYSHPYPDSLLDLLYPSPRFILFSVG